VYSRSFVGTLRNAQKKLVRLPSEGDMTPKWRCHPHKSRPLAPRRCRIRVNRPNSSALGTGANEDRSARLNRERLPLSALCSAQGVTPGSTVQSRDAARRHRYRMLPPCSSVSRVPELRSAAAPPLTPPPRGAHSPLSMALHCRPSLRLGRYARLRARVFWDHPRNSHLWTTSCRTPATSCGISLAAER